MFAARQVTDLDHAGAVWWAETEGQFGSPDRLEREELAMLDDKYV